MADANSNELTKSEHAYESAAAVSAPSEAGELAAEQQKEPEVPQRHAPDPDQVRETRDEGLAIVKLEDRVTDIEKYLAYCPGPSAEFLKLQARVAFLEDFLSRSHGHDITKN